MSSIEEKEENLRKRETNSEAILRHIILNKNVWKYLIFYGVLYAGLRKYFSKYYKPEYKPAAQYLIKRVSNIDVDDEIKDEFDPVGVNSHTPSEFALNLFNAFSNLYKSYDYWNINKELKKDIRTNLNTNNIRKQDFIHFHTATWIVATIMHTVYLRKNSDGYLLVIHHLIGLYICYMSKRLNRGANLFMYLGGISEFIGGFIVSGGLSKWIKAKIYPNKMWIDHVGNICFMLFLVSFVYTRVYTMPKAFYKLMELADDDTIDDLGFNRNELKVYKYVLYFTMFMGWWWSAKAMYSFVNKIREAIQNKNV